MPSCLGLYLENNIIKYAKLTKERDNIRIDAFGMKFYDDVNETVKQIVNETYSYKTPISVNLSEEKYIYSDLFSLLNKKDLEKAVDTEFDYFCEENRKNRNALEYRHILVPNLEDRDKTTCIYSYVDKSSVVRKLQILDAYKVSNVSPLAISIANLNKFTDKKNTIIVNIENNTSVTTIIKGQVYKVDTIETGMKNIFDNIIVKENSYAKAYEICKNTTIYTMQGRNLQVEENEYMEDIMPVLYTIIEKVKEIIKVNGIEIGNIYITGLAASINNIDLYFQENFPDKKCDIITPFFINKSNAKLNVKDYIEVNSAISLALQGLGFGSKTINFKNKAKLEQLSQILSMEIGGSSNKKQQKSKTTTNNKTSNFVEKIKNLINSDSERGLDRIEKGMIRFSISLIILIVLYTAFTKLLINQINEKENEIQKYITDTQTEIAVMTKNIKLVNERAEQYNLLIEKMESANEQVIKNNLKQKAIPNLLTEIMTNIPKEVKLTSIKNTTEKKIKIEAQSKVYEQLGYFIAKIKNEGTLYDVTASSGVRENDFIKITIEGNLPY